MPILESQFNTSFCRRVVSAWEQWRTSDPRPLYQLRIPLSEMPSFQTRLGGSDPYQVYWQNRSGDVEAIGLGTAEMLWAEQQAEIPDVFDRMEKRLESCDDDIRFYGGMVFDRDRPLTSLWSQLGLCRFWIPLIEWRRYQQDAQLIITTTSLEERVLETVLKAVTSSQQTEHPHVDTRVRRETCCPTRDQWQQRVTALIEELKSISGKAVLSFQEIIEFTHTVDPVWLWDRLCAKVEGAYLFSVTVSDHVFLGASPECLYGRHGHEIESEALAGTGPSVRPGVLLSSDKDNQEHNYVIRDMIEALGSICTEVRRSEQKESLIWQDLAHLRTRLSGQLKPSIRDRDILAALHPSAAVLGYPRDRARQWLQTYEDPERGWYAGPIGWIGRDRSEFAVAIRSALICGNRLAMSAGAGIIRESDPKAEWQEVQSKMSLFRDIMELDGV